MICRREDSDQISFDETREQLTTITMGVLQVYGFLTIAAANIALADVIVQPGYSPLGSVHRTAYQHHQTYPTAQHVPQYPTTHQQVYPYAPAYSAPTYPAPTIYQYESQGQNPAHFAEYSSMPAYRYVSEYDSSNSVLVPSTQHFSAHYRGRRSTENRTAIGLAKNVSTSTPINDTETVVDSKNPKTRSIPSAVNGKPARQSQKVEDTPVAKSTLLNLNPDRMYRNLPEYKSTSYEKPAEQPMSIRIIHPEPKMGNSEDQRDTRSWVASANLASKQTDNHHEEHVDEKARHHDATVPDNALRNMVHQMHEMQGIAEDKAQQHGAEQQQSQLQGMLQKVDHVGSSQPVSHASSVQEMGRSHEQHTPQEYITGMAQPSQMPAIQIISYPESQYQHYISPAPQWQMIMPSYYAPHVSSYNEPILGYSPQYATFRNFPDPRPWSASDIAREHTVHHNVAASTEPQNTTAHYRNENALKDTVASEKSAYVASTHTYNYETPQMPSTYSSGYYSYPATFRSYLDPYPMQSYVMHENRDDPNPLLGTSLHRPHHTKYMHKTPGIYDTRPGHSKLITPTYYSYSAVQRENPHYKSYLPSSQYLTQYPTDPAPQMVRYKVYM